MATTKVRVSLKKGINLARFPYWKKIHPGDSGLSWPPAHYTSIQASYSGKVLVLIVPVTGVGPNGWLDHSIVWPELAACLCHIMQSCSLFD